MSEEITRGQAFKVLDAIEQSLGKASDEEIAEHFRVQGRDLPAEAEALRSLLVGSVNNHQRESLRAQHQRSTNLRAQQIRSLPQTPAMQRARLGTMLHKAPAGLTAQFRNLDEMSDEEVESMLIDLTTLDHIADEDDEPGSS